ncbi:AAA family ATPase [Actinoplanes sp. ATCC 53533]|uniref:ATP-binding protein n=1 Tax=Actinoplanes sp. ATCC 53533 TaxID=1288362 RepID=UPI0013157AED|nr:AAA family ATPase [Actinoplanes sp. ATCC 53533]
MDGRPRVVGAATGRPPAMVERTHELAALADCLRGIQGGGPDGGPSDTARVVVVEGVAGIGKTALLEAAREMAAEAGVRTLWARARHLAATAPYDLLRRLLGPAVAARGGPGALTGAPAFAAPLFIPGAGSDAGVDYGCHWLLAALAEEGSLLVAVDDAHWADVDSLRVLCDAAEDLRTIPLAILVAARPTADPAVQPLLARLATLGWASLVRPAPLTESGAAAVLRGAFGRAPDEAFVRACTQASGGNVFYLRELIRPLVAAGLPPGVSAAGELAATGPDALVRTVQGRLGELGEVATRLAQAAAVLGDDTPLWQVSALAGIDAGRAGHEAARLAAAAILARTDPAGFNHPLVRVAVEHTVGPGGLGALHARAARLLDDAAAPARQVVQHLILAPPTGSAQTVRLLTDEARQDLAAGSVTVAHQLLQRALAEPPSASARPAVLLALAESERAVGEPAAARAHLIEVAETGPRELAISAMAELFELLYALDDQEGATRLHDRAFAAKPYGASAAELRLRAQLLVHVATGLAKNAPAELFDFDLGSLPMESGEQRRLLLCAAIHCRAADACRPDEFLAHLRRSVRGLPADRPLTYWETLAALEAAAYLASVEAMADAEAVLERLCPDVARLRGAAPDLQAEWTHRTVLNTLRRGRFEEALARLDYAEEFAGRHRLAVYTGLAHYARGCLHLERGDYREAGRELLLGPVEAGVIGALGDLLSGRPAQALARLALPAGAAAPTEREIEFEAHLVASHAHELLGDRDAAIREAERELAIRRRHGPSFRLALALRRRASFAPARGAVALLEEATRVCAGTPRLPVLARVQASHGAALRRAGRLREARTVLAEALDHTGRLGMTRLGRRVADDLHAAGGRPRRTRVTGVGSLTDSQATVARLAAAGRTNREIAEGLYVSIKTVETHLAAVYRKLAVTRRDQLEPALAGNSQGGYPDA